MFHIFKRRPSGKTRGFYQDLAMDRQSRGVWGKQSRFTPELVANKPSVLRHFVPTVKQYLEKTDKCLDLGCGPGSFLSLMAPLCGEIVGADIVPAFIEECHNFIRRNDLQNASTVLLDGNKLPFDDNEFDKIIMVDTIHHLEYPETTIEEVFRVLKPNGLFLVFEPNKANPLLALMCVLDSNEHGLLRLGTFSAYQNLIGNKANVISQEYNGMLVGPQSSSAVAIADFLSNSKRVNIFGWLSPKLFLVARKEAQL